MDQCEDNIKMLHSLFGLYGVFGIVEHSGEFGIVRNFARSVSCTFGIPVIYDLIRIRKLIL